MPYLAFDLDALENCPNIASGCGLTTPQVTHGLLMLWRHCWREKTDRVNTGHLKSFFFGSPDAIEMLLTFGHLEASEEGWRVKGAARYLRVLEAQSESGKAHSGNLQRGRKDLKPDEKSPGGLRLPSGSPSGYSPALTASSEQRAASSEEKPLRAKKLPAEAPGEHQAIIDSLVVVFESVRGSKYGFSGRDASAVKALRGMAEPAEIERRWRKALTLTFPPVDNIRDLPKAWNRCALSGPAAPPGKGPIDPSTQNHTEGQLAL